MVTVALYISFILIGAIFGGLYCGLIVYRKYAKKPIGVLRVDSSDPDGPYFFLELTTDPNIIKKEDYITLKVDTRSYISHQ